MQCLRAFMAADRLAPLKLHTGLDSLPAGVLRDLAIDVHLQGMPRQGSSCNHLQSSSTPGIQRTPRVCGTVLTVLKPETFSSSS
jgi:hypothetical protein